MYRIVPANPVILPRPHARMSARRVRKLIELGQWWTAFNGDGVGWKVVQIHRKDRSATLERPGMGRREVLFVELGRDFELDGHR